jgi:hypothetical protein
MLQIKNTITFRAGETSKDEETPQPSHLPTVNYDPKTLHVALSLENTYQIK